MGKKEEFFMNFKNLLSSFAAPGEEFEISAIPPTSWYIKCSRLIQQSDICCLMLVKISQKGKG